MNKELNINIFSKLTKIPCILKDSHQVGEKKGNPLFCISKDIIKKHLKANAQFLKNNIAYNREVIL